MTLCISTKLCCVLCNAMHFYQAVHCAVCCATLCISTKLCSVLCNAVHFYQAQKVVLCRSEVPAGGGGGGWRLERGVKVFTEISSQDAQRGNGGGGDAQWGGVECIRRIFTLVTTTKATLACITLWVPAWHKQPRDAQGNSTWNTNIKEINLQKIQRVYVFISPSSHNGSGLFEMSSVCFPQPSIHPCLMCGLWTDSGLGRSSHKGATNHGIHHVIFRLPWYPLCGHICCLSVEYESLFHGDGSELFGANLNSGVCIFSFTLYLKLTNTNALEWYAS